MIAFFSCLGRDSVGQVIKRLGVEGERQGIESRKRRVGSRYWVYNGVCPHKTGIRDTEPGAKMPVPEPVTFPFNIQCYREL